MNPPLRVALYLRASDRKQVEKDISIPAQKEAGLNYIRDNGWELFDVFIDQGISGTHDKRPEFQRLLNIARKSPPPFDIILVWRLNRFARNREISVIYKAMLRKNGIQIVSITQNLNEGDFSSALLEAVTEVIDEFYSKDLGRDTKRGMIKVAREGFYAQGGKPPLGYSVRKINNNKAVRRKLEINSDEAQIVRRIFKLSGEEGLGAYRIAQDLNQAGYRTRGKRAFSSKAVLKILKNEIYTGCQVWGRTKVSNGRRVPEDPENVIRVENTHDAIVTKDLFKKAQNAINERWHGKVAPRSHDSRFLLSSLVYCGHCGASMVGTSAKSGRYDYYNCNTARRRGADGCSCSPIPKKRLEDLVVLRIRSEILTPENASHFVNLANEELLNQESVRLRKIEELQNLIAGLTERIANLYEVLETRAADAELILPRLHDLAEEKRKHETDLFELESRDLSPISDDNICANVEELLSFMESPEILERQRVIRTFVRGVEIKNGRVSINYTLPLQFVFDEPWNRLGSSSVLSIETSASRRGIEPLLLE